MLTSGLVSLGPLRSELLPVYHQWDNDLSITRYGSSQSPRTLEQVSDAIAAATASEREAHFTVYAVDHFKPIGRINLGEIDYRHRTAELVTTFAQRNGEDIGGDGRAAEAVRLLLDYAFTVLGLHNIGARVLEFDSELRSALSQAGFRDCGRRRQAHRLSGRLWDIYDMECLSSEFAASTLRPLVGNAS
jgi:RimJ/RimL family protein N-acetyltransferase